MAVVTLDRICKRYDATTPPAVDDVSLRIDDGEFMVFLGPSGCGKSTTLRMIAGLESITSGELRIDGAPMNGVPAKDRDIAMVFQSYALYPHMNVRNNLAFGLRRRGVARPDIDRRVNDVAEVLGLTPFLGRKPFALSGGQRQRVALGRAIVRDPKVFLLDEPLSNLDAALRVSTRNELIKQHRRLGTTMIYVTHDQVEAMTMGTRICIMSGGKVMQVGAPLEVYRAPADTFVARFLGSPPMNLVPGEVTADAGGPVLRVGAVAMPAPAFAGAAALVPGGRVVVGFRPEDIYEPGEEPAGRSTAEIRGRVLAVEPLGAETLLVLSMDGVEGDVIARVGREAKAAAGEIARLRIDTTAIHLFDPETTRAIAPAGRP